MSGDALHQLGVAGLARQLAARAISSEELVRHVVQRVQAHGELGAFLHLDADAALDAARAADARRTRGESAPLLGVPIAHKDIFVTADAPTTAGSKMLAGYRSPFDATVVARLKAAGTVSLGKLNCDEFAMGSANENSAYAPVRNPWDRARVPGGSSGGSAAAVAARLVPAATGTDTGGSIRQPASFSGITGIKPTYGVCSRFGMIAFASSLDQAGPLARSAEDCALLLSAMSGFDERDATSAQRPPQEFHAQMLAPRAGASAERPLQGLRVGLPREFFPAGLSADVERSVRAALAELEKLGATLVDVSLPRTELSIPVYYIIAPAEASSNLSRFDGVKFGHRAAEYADLLDMYKKTRSQGFGAEVKRRIMIGTYVLSHGYYDAYYLQAQKLRRMIADDFQRCFTECDVIAGPVAPSVAWKLGEQGDDPVKAYLADIFTLPASLAGLPGMSVPAGLGEHGMPVGLQLIGNYFQEGTLLHAAHAFQQATDWHARSAGRILSDERRPPDPRLRGRHRPRNARPVVDERQDLLRRQHRLRRCAQHPGLRGGPGPARHAAGDEPRRGGTRHPLRPGGGCEGGAACRSSRARTTSTPTCPRATRSASTKPRWCRAARSASCSRGQRRTVNLTRAHLEEDAGKSLHEDYHGQTGIDLNRAGTPLLEIVTEPDMRSAAEAVEYARALHALVMWLGVCDGNMQEGSFRCDANVSVRRPGAPFGTRREIKNLNSFRFMQQAIEFEVNWQIDRIEDGLADRAGHRAVQPRQRRDPGHAQQGRRARLPLLPRPRPAAAGDRAGMGGSEVRAAMPELPAADGRALPARRRHCLPTMPP